MSLPMQYISALVGETVQCCAVSSHLFVAIEAIKNQVFCFHVPTGLLIRCLELRGEPQSLMINDTYQMIFSVGTNFIEVHTINGTLVAFKEVTDDPITASSISLNDVSVFLATGHASGKIILWDINAADQILVQRAVLTVDGPVSYLDVISEGSAMIATTKSATGEATIFCARGIGKKLFEPEYAISCATCKSTKKLSLCMSCGLYFCSACSRQSGTTVCSKCLQHIEEAAAVLDSIDI